MEALNFSLDFVQIDLESALFVSDLLKDLLLFASHRIAFASRRSCPSEAELQKPAKVFALPYLRGWRGT